MRKKSLIIFLLLLAALISCAISFAAEKEKGQQENGAVYKHVVNSAERNSLRIALCHLDVSQGSQEKNIEKIEKAIHSAGQHGANWILTPETALQGYYFYVIDSSQKEKIKEQKKRKLHLNKIR